MKAAFYLCLRRILVMLSPYSVSVVCEADSSVAADAG
jgi:hypothetical protein